MRCPVLKPQVIYHSKRERQSKLMHHQKLSSQEITRKLMKAPEVSIV
jgi:hypothetical protein